MDTGIRAHMDLPVVKTETHNSNPPHNKHHSDSLWNVPEEGSREHQCPTQHGDGISGTEDAKNHFIQQDGRLCSLSSLKSKLMDRERQRRHRERVRADPEKQQAYRERERQRYQRRKNMVIALPEQMTAESQSHGLSDTEYQTGPTVKDHSHPNNYAFQDMSQNSDTETGNMAQTDNMVTKRPTPEADIVDTRQQIKEMNPQSDDEKERRRFMDRERQRRRRERMRAEPDQQQSCAERDRQRLLDRERQRRCRQRLQADPVRWQAYLEKERCRSREAARRSRAKKSLAKALTGWISDWGQGRQ
ncbi:hypothetical protein AALO_G00182860 [Alosa alosa]|uniref:Uncharacterized protein n=1 Tax=Alosa alosa TaxID=278164 RepID=A0AAV6GE93_9TELE|nr:hypothetical protein AALO_G00182860 [Alosa alosa]